MSADPAPSGADPSGPDPAPSDPAPSGAGPGKRDSGEPGPAERTGGGGRNRCRGWELAVLALLAAVLAAGVRGEITRSGNESSRLATVESLVERGTTVIEESGFTTVDRVRIGGHFHANKPLLLSLWLAVLYAPLHLVAGLSFEGAGRPLVIRLLTLLGITLFSLLLAWMFQRRLRERGGSCAPSLLLGVAVVLTTWIWSYGITVNNHTPAAALLFALVWTLERAEREPSPRRALLAGLLAAVLLAVEIPTGGVFFLVGLAVLGLDRGTPFQASIGSYLAGFLAVTLVLAGVNQWAYGLPVDAYLVPEAFDFPGSVHAAGPGGLRRPPDVVAYLFHVTLGYRGLWSHMPFLLLALPWLWSRRHRPGRTTAASALAVLVLLLFYGTRTGIYGGWAYGFRFLIPLIPLFFWWASLWILERPSSLRTTVAGLALAVGLFTSWVGSLNPWPVAYEAAGTRPDAVEAEVRSPLLTNLMVWSFERDPDGPLFRWIVRRVYGPSLAVRYLAAEYWNRREPARIEQVRHMVERWRRDALRDGAGDAPAAGPEDSPVSRPPPPAPR